MTADQIHSATHLTQERRVPLPVQMLTVVFYTGFAITVSVVAMVFFGMIGIAVALILAWQWGRIAARGGEAPKTEAPRPAPERSGNAAFDAYRDDVLARLEQDQADFAEFLDRLRAAKDRTEFEQFMGERDASPAVA